MFPQIAIKDLGEGGRVFVPVTAGVELANLWSKADKKGGTYPSGWTCMQYMAAYNKTTRTGLYVGVHDPFGSTKDILAEGQPAKHAVVLRFDHPVPNMGKAGTGFELPGEARWQLLRGDWFDAAQIYRAWVSQKAKWWPTLGPDGREDTPQWMRELPAWVMTGGSASECVPRVKAFAQTLGVPVGFHWYNWHQIPFDNDYPHYFPPKDGFREGVAELKTAGVYPMPYINGRLWDTHDKGAEDWEFTRVALAAATKDEAGKPYTESYGSKETDGNSVKLAVMCPATGAVAEPGPRHRAASVQRVRRQRRVHRPDRRGRAATVLRRLSRPRSRRRPLVDRRLLDDAHCHSRRQTRRVHAHHRVQRRAVHQVVRRVSDLALAGAEHGAGVLRRLWRRDPDVRTGLPRRAEPGPRQSHEGRTAIGLWRADRLVWPGSHRPARFRQVPPRLHPTSLAARRSISTGDRWPARRG